jgi:hypothetical protein
MKTLLRNDYAVVRTCLLPRCCELMAYSIQPRENTVHRLSSKSTQGAVAVGNENVMQEGRGKERYRSLPNEEAEALLSS